MESLSRFLYGMLLSGAVGLAAAPACSAIVFSQNPAQGGEGYFSNYGAAQQSADNFFLGAGTDVYSLAWWGSYGDTGTSHDDWFVVRIFDGSMPAGVPVFTCGDAAAASFVRCAGVTRSATSLLDDADHPIFRYDFELTPALDVKTSRSHLLSITNDTDASWFWLRSEQAGDGSYFRQVDEDPFELDAQQPAPDLSFALAAAHEIPEPGVLSLLGLAAVLGLSLRWRAFRAARPA